MQIIPAKFISDDGVEFTTKDECIAHESALPYVKLLADVKAAAAENTWFSDEIEKLGRQLAAGRIDRGERKRKRKGDNVPAEAPSAPDDREAYERLLADLMAEGNARAEAGLEALNAWLGDLPEEELALVKVSQRTVWREQAAKVGP